MGTAEDGHQPPSGRQTAKACHIGAAPWDYFILVAHVAACAHCLRVSSLFEIPRCRNAALHGIRAAVAEEYAAEYTADATINLDDEDAVLPELDREELWQDGQMRWSTGKKSERFGNTYNLPMTTRQKATSPGVPRSRGHKEGLITSAWHRPELEGHA